MITVHAMRAWIARFSRRWLPLDRPRRAELPALRRGRQALAVMERHLADNRWFGGHGCGIADIALYACPQCAGGGFELAGFPGIRAWLNRVQVQPADAPMHC